MSASDEELLKKARKAASAVYLATEEYIAKDISGIIRELIERVLVLNDQLERNK